MIKYLEIYDEYYKFCRQDIYVCSTSKMIGVTSRIELRSMNNKIKLWKSIIYGEYIVFVCGRNYTQNTSFHLNT